jgi:aconitate hydratase
VPEVGHLVLQARHGVSHPVHMQRFGVPGKTLLGSDSHTCAASSLGMLAIAPAGSMSP